MLRKNRKQAQASSNLLETLEARRLFAVAIGMPAADTLTFTGNFQDDRIHINDNGAGVVSGAVSNAAGVMVPFGAVAGIRRLIINTGDGRDTVTVRLTGDMLAGGPHELSVRLGTGDDTFKYDATNDIDIGVNDYAFMRVLGERGNDYLAYAHRGEIDGSMSVTLDGGSESDRLYTDEKCDLGSTGAFAANSNAGTGKDVVDLLVRKSNPADPIFISAFASSGADADWDELTRTPLAGDDGLFNLVNVVP